MQNIFGKRIYTLDILRGVAALSVVLWHWQHFFMGDNGEFIAREQPFYDYLSIFYTHGLYAVELFFTISGFIFFYLYQDKIKNKKVTLKIFTINRLSRLYPLYFISFILVAILQLIFIKTHGSYFVYQINDMYHAILNLLMIQSWGFEHGWSYNAPTWSISIEVLMYALFFLLCLYTTKNTTALMIIVIVSFFLRDVNNAIMIGVFCFFLGGVCFNVTQRSINKFGAVRSLLGSSLISLLGWSVIYLLHTESIFIIISFGFTPFICFLASLNASKNNLGKKIEWLGDISYSSYLLHFPLQMVFVIISDMNGFSRNLFYSKSIMIAFFALLIAISYFSYKFIENPSQKMIRQRLFK